MSGGVVASHFVPARPDRQRSADCRQLARRRTVSGLRSVHRERTSDVACRDWPHRNSPRIATRGSASGRTRLNPLPSIPPLALQPPRQEWSL